MIELSLRDIFMGLMAAISGAGAYFMLRGRVKSLEDKHEEVKDAPVRLAKIETQMGGLDDNMKRIHNSLERIESKLDEKADK